MAGHVARIGERKVVYRVLLEKPGRSRSRWADNIKMDFQKVRCGAWTGLIWLRIGTGGGQLKTR
jgi:hypothetical protein